MAKGSFNGVISGKKGNTVYYYLRNSNNAEKQGWREYNAKVSNPQTDGQIDQRVKLAAVNNLYRALKPIIQRGWENHKYGDESRRAFLKKALGASFEGPYLEKGSTLAVPIEGVPITYGSLTPVVVECDSSDGVVVITNVPFEGDTSGTIGFLSSLYIGAGLAQKGDQVTYIIASLNTAGTVSYFIRSFYVDPDSAELSQDVLGFTNDSIIYEGEDVLSIDVSALGANTTHFAAMVSISRDGEGTNLRSYAEFDMTTEFKTYFYGSASQVERAKASYRKKVSSSTNWPLVPDGGYTPVVQSAFTRAGTEFLPVSIARKNVGGQNFEVIVDDGGVQYYIGSRPSAASSEIVYLSGTGSTASVDPSDLTTANSVNVFDSANVAAGLRAWLISKGVDATVLPV